MRQVITICCLFSLAGDVPAAQVRKETDRSVTSLTLEDLQDALDRGDLTQQEFDLLAALVNDRLAADSVEWARLNERILQAPESETRLSSIRNYGRVRYSAWAPLRGSAAAGQHLQIEPAVGSCAAQVAARCSGRGPWYVTRAAVSAETGPVGIELGSIDPIWTGGLVVGRFPVFTSARIPGIAGLWQPDRSRLWGGRVQLAAGRFDAEVLGSTVSDSSWQHKVGGMRCRANLGRHFIEPALVYQRLARRSGGGAYSSLVWGVSARAAGSMSSLEMNSAFAGRTVALQVRAAGKTALANWESEYWAVPPGFRHPLLQARGEYDRESVEYPELGTALESASTGESGGRLAVRFGGSRTYARLSAALWREQPQRPAAVRLSATAQQTRGSRMLRLGYVHTSRFAGESRENRHEAGLLARYGRVFGEIRARCAWSDGLPFGAAGGSLAGGVRVHTPGAGRWEARAAWDTHDLSLASRQFVTLRVDQVLPFRRGEVAVHLRWRSAYSSQPAALGVRIDSSVYL